MTCTSLAACPACRGSRRRQNPSLLHIAPTRRLYTAARRSPAPEQSRRPGTAPCEAPPALCTFWMPSVRIFRALGHGQVEIWSDTGLDGANSAGHWRGPAGSQPHPKLLEFIPKTRSDRSTLLISCEISTERSRSGRRRREAGGQKEGGRMDATPGRESGGTFDFKVSAHSLLYHLVRSRSVVQPRVTSFFGPESGRRRNPIDGFILSHSTAFRP